METIIKAKKDLYNLGKCFSKGKTYSVAGHIKNPAGLMESITTNDQRERHIIGSFWRDFQIVSHQ